MATLKHINSKNADYGAAEQYLLFEHDEFTMKPVLDETGRLIPREDYRLSTLNCGGEDFAVACMRANLRYEKNQRREDVKSHHYIISFDPRDGPDNGLTVDRAQELGEKFCAEHFPGHQALVCTHPDGHNHSGNIHVHIVINSLRIEEVPFPKDIAAMEQSLKRLEEREQKYSAELDAALNEYAGLREQAQGFNRVQLYEARQAIRPGKEQEAENRAQEVYGEKYNPLLMFDSKKAVSRMLHEDIERQAVRRMMRQAHKEQQTFQKKKSEQER